MPGAARARATTEPVIDGLDWWGLRHAWRFPQAGEPLHAEHLLRAVTQAISHAADDHQPARWHLRLDGGDYLIASDGRQWTFTAGAPADSADVTITAATPDLCAFIFAGSDRDVDITGQPQPVERCRRLIRTMAAVVASV